MVELREEIKKASKNFDAQKAKVASLIVPPTPEPKITTQEITEGSLVQIQCMQFTSMRVMIARARKCEKNIIIQIWGGIGDQLCAEPTVRFALETFKDTEISIATHYPEFFRHLKLKRVFDLKDVQPIWSQYAVFATGWPPDNILNDFVCNLYVHCVDWPALSAFRTQLPISYRAVKVQLNPEDFVATKDIPRNAVIIHPGKHWPSKTFPKDFWDAVILEVKAKGCVPVIIGADADENRTTVNVDTEGCIDLRNKLSYMETIALLDSQDGRALLTNDSAPLHLAAPTRAWIGFVATCKRADYLYHYRDVPTFTGTSLYRKFGARMENFGRGGFWDLLDLCPNKGPESSKYFGKVDEIEEDILRTWLPDPKEFAAWACMKVLKQ